jgi:uncharacterized protein (TIGR04222 family)
MTHERDRHYAGRRGEAWVVEPYLVVCGVLLLGSVLARALPATRRSFDSDHEDGWDLTPRELAYLRRGSYGVVLTVLAELHGAGALDLSRGRLDRLDPCYDLDDRIAVAVYAGMNQVHRPWRLALLPRVRKACAPLRLDLRERRLLPPLRRRIFAAALLVYAGGLATATMLESDVRGSTVVGAFGVWSAAGLLALGPRLTLAGSRELRSHRHALAGVAAEGDGEAAYLADLVAAYGVAAVWVLCRGPIPSGALAPPAPSYEPRPVAPPAPVAVPPLHQRPVLVPVPAVVALPDDSLRTLREFPVLELPARRAERLPVAA